MHLVIIILKEKFFKSYKILNNKNNLFYFFYSRVKEVFIFFLNRKSNVKATIEWSNIEKINMQKDTSRLLITKKS